MAFYSRRKNPEDQTQKRVFTTEQTLEMALKRLSVREHSFSEVKSYLNRKGVAPETASEVLERLKAQGLIDDRRFMKALTRDQSARGKGPRYILMKLQQKGVKTDIKEAKKVFDESADQSEHQMIKQVLERRYPKALGEAGGESGETRKEKQRAFQGLLRRGFSSDAVRKVIFSKGNLQDLDAESEPDLETQPD